jgi:hypothetical protein
MVPRRDRNAPGTGIDKVGVFHTLGSKKPLHFCKGFNDGASTRDRTRDTRIFNANSYLNNLI